MDHRGTDIREQARQNPSGSDQEHVVLVAARGLRQSARDLPGDRADGLCGASV